MEIDSLPSIYTTCPEEPIIDEAWCIRVLLYSILPQLGDLTAEGGIANRRFGIDLGPMWK